MKLALRSDEPSWVLQPGVRYHRIGVRIGDYVYGAGFATGGRGFALLHSTGRGTYWLWRFAVCRKHIDDLRDGAPFRRGSGA